MEGGAGQMRIVLEIEVSIRDPPSTTVTISFIILLVTPRHVPPVEQSTIFADRVNLITPALNRQLNLFLASLTHGFLIDRKPCSLHSLSMSGKRGGQESIFRIDAPDPSRQIFRG